MSSKLKTLRSSLDSLRKRRSSVRLTTAYSGFLAAAIWVVFGCFLLDWALGMNGAQRVILMLISAYGLVYSFRRYAAPLLQSRESLFQTALLVEKTKGIDSDLIAALQFEEPGAEDWGSAELQDAVKDNVAEMSKGLDVFEGYSADDLGKRVAAFLVSGLLVGFLAVTYPGYTSAFLDRLLFGAELYPTNTTIEKIAIGGLDEEGKPDRMDDINVRTGKIVDSGGNPRGPFGKPLHFQIECKQKQGDLPEKIKVEFDGTLEADLTLNDEDKDGVYEGELARLTEGLDFRIRAGDGLTHWFEIELIALPKVDVELASTDPDYARKKNTDADKFNNCTMLGGKGRNCETGNLQIEVKEGSRVDVALRSDKDLKQPEIEIRKKRYKFVRRSEGDAKIWDLTVTDTPLAVVQKRLNYRISAEDTDGLHPEPTIEGIVQIESDKPPRVRASMVSRYVLPTAKPMIDIKVVDDYGFSKAKILVEVSRQKEEAEQEDPVVITLSEEQKASTSFKHRLACDLTPYELEKGDVVRLFVEVTDDRGDLQGESSKSEALSMQVTDLPGFLKSINELDERSVRQIDAIIEKELGIQGESK